MAKLITLPKKPQSSGREEISLGGLDHTPDTDRKFESSNMKIKKNYPYPTQRLTGGKLDKNMIKNYILIDDRMELKIIPFKYERKINKKRLYLYRPYCNEN